MGTGGPCDDEAAILSELGALAGRHRELVGKLERRRALRVETATAQPTFGSYCAAIIDGRRLFGRYVPGLFFADPAFDMMLDLFVAAERGEGRRTKACVAASRVPDTTALRYLNLMEHAGLITRTSDPDDGRVSLISLTESAQNGMRDWLSAICSIPLRRDIPRTPL